jgi:endonuclease YncB( thermonuclease family)
MLPVAGCNYAPDITTGYTKVDASFATAIDGDTFKITARRYRLAGIDAPELSTHSRAHCAQRAAHGGPSCASGDPYAAKAALQWYINEGMWCRATGIDVYQRTLVECVADHTQGTLSVNESMIALGYAIRWPHD